jgi:hypothetical protein
MATKSVDQWDAMGACCGSINDAAEWQMTTLSAPNIGFVIRVFNF